MPAILVKSVGRQVITILYKIEGRQSGKELSTPPPAPLRGRYAASSVVFALSDIGALAGAGRKYSRCQQKPLNSC